MTVEDLYTNAFDNIKKGWIRVGTSPYLNDTNDYVRSDGSISTIGDWGFPNTAAAAGDTINAVSLRLECNKTAAGFPWITVYVHDGSSWNFAGVIDPSVGLWEWFDIDVTSILNTIAKINACKVYLADDFGTVTLMCRRLVRRVNYSPPPPPVAAGKPIWTLLFDHAIV